MFHDGDRVEVRNRDGPGWIAAAFVGVAIGEPRHIDHPGINAGRGYEADQMRVMYLEGEREGSFGLHISSEIRRPGGKHWIAYEHIGGGRTRVPISS
jgi:hypothetical protein